MYMRGCLDILGEEWRETAFFFEHVIQDPPVSDYQLIAEAFPTYQSLHAYKVCLVLITNQQTHRCGPNNMSQCNTRGPYRWTTVWE